MFLYYFAPKIQIARFSEMLVMICQTSLRHIPEESSVHSHRHEDLRPHIATIFAYVGIGPLYTSFCFCGSTALVGLGRFFSSLIYTHSW
jgi:hypothetical protein